MSDTTIVIATRDRPDMLPRAVQSARRTGAEVIVIDDGSAVPVVGARVRVGQSIGLIRARMAGLVFVETPRVLFLDDDDWLEPDILDACREHDEDVVAQGYWEVRGDRLTAVPLLPATLSRLLSGHCPVNDGAWTRTELLRGDGLWRPERRTAAMFSLWLALASRGASFGVVEHPCWYHRIHDGQMSATLPPLDATWRAEAIAEHRVAA